MGQAQDARRAPRQPVRLTCKVMSKLWNQPVPMSVADLSPHGMWIDTDFPLHVGDATLVSFQPPRPARRPVVLAAVVVRTSLAPGHAGMAVQFVDVRPSTQQVLAQALAPHARRVLRRRRKSGRRRLPSLREPPRLRASNR